MSNSINRKNELGIFIEFLFSLIDKLKLITLSSNSRNIHNFLFFSFLPINSLLEFIEFSFVLTIVRKQIGVYKIYYLLLHTYVNPFTNLTAAN